MLSHFRHQLNVIPHLVPKKSQYTHIVLNSGSQALKVYSVYLMLTVIVHYKVFSCPSLSPYPCETWMHFRKVLFLTAAVLHKQDASWWLCSCGYVQSASHLTKRGAFEHNLSLVHILLKWPATPKFLLPLLQKSMWNKNYT